MISKNMLLSVLLIPATIIGKDTIDVRMQKLEEKLSQKELELSNLGKMIAEKDEFFSSFNMESQRLLRLLIDKRVKQLEEQKSGKSLSQEEKNKVAIEMQNKANEFLYKFFDALKGDKAIDGMLSEGLFQKNEIAGEAGADFESLRFYLIRHTFEQMITMHLVKKYEDCIKEYRDLLRELSNLQKQSNMQLR